MANKYIPTSTSSQKNKEYHNNEIFYEVQLAQVKQHNNTYCWLGYGENNLLLICW